MLTLRTLTYGAITMRILLAIVIGGILGLERGRKNRPAGLRTYMLVCLGSAIVMMANQYVYQVFGTSDPVRLGAQVISGIGFLGAGSIIVTQRNQIRGITTAAGLWAAACLGLAIGIGFYEVALLGGFMILITLSVMQKFNAFTKKNSNVIDIYVELKSHESITKFVQYIRDCGLTMSNLQLENDSLSASEGIAFVVTIKSKAKKLGINIRETLRKIPDLKFIEEL